MATTWQLSDDFSCQKKKMRQRTYTAFVPKTVQIASRKLRIVMFKINTLKLIYKINP